MFNCIGCIGNNIKKAGDDANNDDANVDDTNNTATTQDDMASSAPSPFLMTTPIFVVGFLIFSPGF